MVAKRIALFVCLNVLASSSLIAQTVQVYDFENLAVGSNLASDGWVGLFGDNASSWKVATPSGTGNFSNRVGQIDTTVFAQAVRPFDSPTGYTDNDLSLYYSALIRPTLDIWGGLEPMRVGLKAGSGITGDTTSPRFGFQPVGNELRYMIRTSAGITSSSFSAQVGNWYELLLQVTQNPISVSTSTGTLFVRNVTAGETTRTPIADLTGINLGLSSTNRPATWDSWYLDGLWGGGAVDNLTTGLGGVDLSPELGVSGPVLAPIVHQAYWNGERELFGYNPAFSPNVVTFDSRNRPYIRKTGNWYWNGHPIEPHPEAVLQTLDADGQWTVLNYQSAIQAAYPTWDQLFQTMPFAEERVVFDDQDNAYMIANLTRSNVGKPLLMHSTDYARTWEIYELPDGWARFEFQDGHNQINGPPVILNFTGPGSAGVPARLSVYKPTKNPDGTLSLPTPTLISTDSALPQNHTGGANSTVTLGNLTHITWNAKTADPLHAGTPIYTSTYNNATGQLVGQPTLLGYGNSSANNNAPDDHNVPGMSADSQGYLNVVIGAHHDQFSYTKSLQPNCTTCGWTAPVPIGLPVQPGEGSYTYVSLVIDQDDTMHVVARWAGDGYIFRQVYLRKKAGQPWEDHKILTVPFKNFYSNWYQKLSIDELGRLFLNYSYLGNQLTVEAADAYRLKYPNDPITFTPEFFFNWYDGVDAHDPAMLISDNGGDTWRLGLTQDFLDGIITRPGDFDGNGIVDGADFLLWQQGFGTIYDQSDLSDWQANFGLLASVGAVSTSGQNAVPEPSSLLLVIVGLLCLARLGRSQTPCC